MSRVRACVIAWARNYEELMNNDFLESLHA